MSRACFVAVRAPPLHICSKMTFGGKGGQGENKRGKSTKKRLHRAAAAVL